MMGIPLLTLLLQGIPECTAVVTLAFVIARIPLNWSKIGLMGIFLAVFTYGIRQLPIPFGLHLIFGLIFLFAFILKFGHGDLSLSLISSISSYLALIIFETVCSLLIMPIFGVTFVNAYYSNIGISILLGEPQVLILFCIAFLLDKLSGKRGQNNELIVNQQ